MVSFKFLQYIYTIFDLDNSKFKVVKTQIETAGGIRMVPGMFTVFSEEKNEPKIYLSIQDIFNRLSEKSIDPIIGQDFSNIDFSGAKISGLTFVDCDFNGSRFIKSNLSESNFKGCEFSRSDLSRANLGKTKFDNCDFQLAKITEAFGENSLFRQCNFLMSDLWQAVIPFDSFIECWGTDNLKNELDYRI